MQSLLHAFREQKRLSLYVVIAFCLFAALWQWGNTYLSHPYRDIQKQFMSMHGSNWIEAVSDELESANAKTDAFYAVEYISQEMFRSISELDESGAVYTDSLDNDISMLSELYEEGQMRILAAENLSNAKLLYHRNAEKYAERPYWGKVYSRLEKSYRNIQVADENDVLTGMLLFTNEFFTTQKSDLLFVLIAFIVSFHYFANMLANGEGRLILTSGKNVRNYIAAQYLAGICTTVVLTLVYEGIKIVLWWTLAFRGRWMLPIQSVTEGFSIGLHMSILEYALANVGMNLLVAVTVSAVVQVVSFWSPNLITAFFGGIAATAGVMVLLSGIMLGNENGLKLRHAGLSWCEEIPFVNICGQPVSYFAVLLIVVFCVVVLCGGFLALCGRRRIVGR